MPEKEAFTSTLASFVPKLILEQLGRQPVPTLAPSARDFQAVVLFADISGFTAITERFARQGPHGVETLTRVLNQVFGQLIDLVEAAGGDVVKFAGDAAISIWPVADGPASPDELRRWTLRAAECALQIRASLLNFQAEGVSLELKLGIGVGQIWHVIIGGESNRWEYMLVGDPLMEIGKANQLAASGDIILCPSAWTLVREDCDASRIYFTIDEESHEAALLTGLKQVAGLLPVSGGRPIPADALAAISPFIPRGVLSRLTAGQSDWLAEFRKLTLLFVNLPELNQNTSLDAAQELMRAIQACVYRYEGSINKIGQDDKGITIDVAFGLPPLAHEDDPLRAVQTALLLRDELRKRGLHGSIGLTTGRVFCGVIGNATRRKYTFFGAPIILAARIMALAMRQTEMVIRDGIAVCCDRATFEAASIRVEFDSIPAQTVKGFRDPVEVFVPLRQKKEIRSPQKSLVGRQAEKRVLAGALQELTRGVPFQAIILQGEPGTGKSTLMEELLQQGRRLPVKVFHGSGEAIEKNTPYYAWRPVFSSLLGVQAYFSKAQLSDEDRGMILDAVLAHLAEIDPDLTRYAPLLNPVLPIAIPENEFTAVMSGEVRGSNMRDIFTRLLQRQAGQAPLLLALEDIQWLDSASWDLLADTVQRVRPLLLVVDTRPLSGPVPGPFSELAGRPETRYIHLDMLPPEELEQLVCQKLGVRSIPGPVARVIHAKSDGHPFFAEELAYALRDSGALVIKDGECRLAPGLTDLEVATLPENLQAAITSRIDGLSPLHQLILKVASVIGRVFAFRLLSDIYPIETDRPALPGGMDTLQRASLILLESEGPDLAYLFKHSVTQEVAYNLMLYGQRRQLHRAAGEWIEQNHQQDLDAYYPLLAYHWQQAASLPASRPDEQALGKAVDYLEKAGDQALTNDANEEALKFFTGILELVDPAQVSPLRLSRWYGQLGEAYFRLGNLAEARQQLFTSMALLGRPFPASDARLVAGILWEIARQAGHRLLPALFCHRTFAPDQEQARRAFALLAQKLSVVQYLIGDPSPLPMLYSVLAGLNAAEAIPPTPELWSMYASASAMAGFIPLHAQSRHYQQRWFTLGETFKDPNRFVDGALSLCAVISGNGKWQEVKDLAGKAFAICEELGDSNRAVEANALLAINTLLEGGPALVAPHNRLGWEIATRRENPVHIAFISQTECAALVWTGAFDACIETAQKCLARSEKSTVGEMTEYIVRSAMWLAMWRKGERDGVWDAVRSALNKFARASVADYATILIHTHLAEIAFLALGAGRQDLPANVRREEIEKDARLAIKNLARFTAVFSIGGPALNRYRGLLAVHKHRPQQAYQYWRAAADQARAFPMSYELGQALLLLGRYLPPANPARAGYLREARQVFETSGYTNWARVAQDELG